MNWSQNYDPLGWWPLSTLVSALPVLTLFFVLLVLRKRVWVSALCGMVMAVVIAAAVFAHAGAAHRRRRGERRRLRLLPDRLDHHRVDLPLQRGGRDRAVPGDEGVDRGRLLGPAPAGHPHRVLLRRLPGRDGRRGGAGGDRGLLPDRPRLPALPGGHPVPPRQHRARRLGWRRQPHPRAERGDRPAHPRAQRDGGSDPAALLLDPARLARRHMVGWRRALEVLPALAGERRVVRGHAVLLVQLPGDGPRGHRGRHLLAAGDGGVPALLEAAAADGGRGGGAHVELREHGLWPCSRAGRPSPWPPCSSSCGRCPASAST